MQLNWRKHINARALTALLLLSASLSFATEQGRRTGASFAQPQEKKMTNDQTRKESPFACNMKALTADQRKRHTALIKRLFAVKQEIRELPDGYAFRYAADTDLTGGFTTG